MQALQHIVLSLMKIVISGVSALALLSVVAFFYKYNTLGNHSITGAVDAVYDPGSITTNFSEGYGWNRMDELGFGNPRVIRHPEVLVMGGSHIQAAQLPDRENLVGVLNQRYGDDFAYNIGESGHWIDILVYHLDNACAYFKPKYVVLDLNDFYPDESAMKAVLDGTRKDPHLLSDSGALVKYIRKYVPASGTILINLQSWMSKSIEEGAIGEEREYSADYYTLREKFFAFAAKAANKHDTHLILLYHPGDYHLGKEGSLVFDDSDEEYENFCKMCSKYGITVVSTKQTVIAMYEQDHVLPNGFINSTVGAGHLNKYGHAAMADVLADAITKLEAQQ